jgi:DNA polymerase elongation subunit (family B)
MMQPLLILDVSTEGDDANWWTAIRVVDIHEQTHVLKVFGCKPIFYTAKPKKDHPWLTRVEGAVAVKATDKYSVDGKELMSVECTTPWAIRKVRDHYYPHYAADAKWASLVRWTYGWEAVISVDDKHDWSDLRPVHLYKSETPASSFSPSLLYFDIETADSLDMENSPEPVVSIALYDGRTGVHEIATTAHTSERLVKRFMASQEALEDVVEHDQPIPPIDRDKVVLVNCEGDTLAEREVALLNWWHDALKRYDPDVIAGQNIKGYDIPYLVNRCKRLKYKEGRKVPNLGYMRRMPTFDTKIAYAEQVQGAAATTGAASLSWMAHSTLGYGKVPRTRIVQLMQEDPMMLAVYNAWDNVCAHRCMDKLDLFPFYIMKVAYHNSTLHNSHSNMMLVEDMMGHLLMEEDRILPSVQLVRESMPESGIEQGGFVMDAPTGIWKNAFELDNSMEYPSAIITGNFGPDTKVNPDDYPDGYPFPVTKTRGGRVYRRDYESIMARVLRNLASARQAIKDEMKTVTDQDTLLMLDRQQRVMKENMNSWYGVLGSGRTEKTRNRPFRLADPEIGSDITETARLHNDWNKHYINKRTLWYCDQGVYTSKDYIPPSHRSVELRFGTLYQDTDSCKVAILNHDEAEKAVRPFTEQDVVDMAQILCSELNDSFDDFTKETLNVAKNEFFNIKPDAYYERYFQWGVKKRYAYRQYNGKHGYRGVELRRSSSPPVVKQLQQAVFDCILDGGEATEVSKVVRDYHESMLDAEATPQADFGQPFGVKKEGTFAHKAAMWSNDNLGTTFDLGDKPLIFFAKEAPAPLPANRRVAVEWGDTPEKYGITVDRAMSIESLFANSNSFAAILGALGTNWDRCVTGIGTTTLDQWFS